MEKEKRGVGVNWTKGKRVLLLTEMPRVRFLLAGTFAYVNTPSVWYRLGRYISAHQVSRHQAKWYDTQYDTSPENTIQNIKQYGLETIQDQYDKGYIIPYRPSLF